MGLADQEATQGLRRRKLYEQARLLCHYCAIVANLRENPVLFISLGPSVHFSIANTDRFERVSSVLKGLNTHLKLDNAFFATWCYFKFGLQRNIRQLE